MSLKYEPVSHRNRLRAPEEEGRAESDSEKKEEEDSEVREEREMEAFVTANAAAVEAVQPKEKEEQVDLLRILLYYSQA